MALGQGGARVFECLNEYGSKQPLELLTPIEVPSPASNGIGVKPCHTEISLSFQHVQQEVPLGCHCSVGDRQSPESRQHSRPADGPKPLVVPLSQLTSGG